MPPGNRLAPVTQNAFGSPPTLAEIQLAARTAQRPSPMSLAQRAQELNYGLGRGFTNILQGNLDLAQALYQDPRAVGMGFVDAATQFAQDPAGVVGNSLRGMWNRAKSSPAGLGEVVGENIDPRNWLKPRKALRKELDVYHGTPHTFPAEEGAPLGRFRSEKIGTGEGAQAFGYGLYFAESPDVAGEYRQIAGNLPSHVGGGFAMSDAAAAKLDALSSALNLRSEYDRGIFGVYDDLRVGEFTPDILKRKLAKALKAGEIEQDYYDGAMQGFKNAEKVFAETKGSRYKVDLPDAKIEQMLDWDKPLSEQPKSVRDALQKAGIVDFENNIGPTSTGEIKSLGWTRSVENLRGEELYRRLTERDYTPEKFAAGAPRKLSERAASDVLRSLGIPGIKFLDQGSRAAGQGTRNFVVFPGEEQHLKILGRD